MRRRMARVKMVGGDEKREGMVGGVERGFVLGDCFTMNGKEWRCWKQ